jgi:hypothetical protein
MDTRVSTCGICQNVYTVNTALDDPCLVGCGSTITSTGDIIKSRDSILFFSDTCALRVGIITKQFAHRVICDWCILQNLYLGRIGVVAGIGPARSDFIRMSAAMHEMQKGEPKGHPYDMVFANMLLVHVVGKSVFALFRYNGRIYRVFNDVVSCMSGPADKDEQMLQDTIGKFMGSYRFDKLL